MASLDAREWRDLLELMQDRSEYRKEQNAIALMFEHTNVEETLQNITLDKYKFEFNMALLGSSNHTGHNNGPSLQEQDRGPLTVATRRHSIGEGITKTSQMVQTTTNSTFQSTRPTFRNWLAP